MKKYFFVLTILFCFPFLARAELDYIYKNKANWVKIQRASVVKNLPVSNFKHPVTGLSEEQMEAMLLSLKIDRKFLLKKDVESIDVFSSWEARKFSAYFVEALAKLTGDTAVNFAVIHKRPEFILRNDRVSTGNMWFEADGVHIQFTKLFAKIVGDYESSTNMDRELRRAKTLHVTLDVSEGQKLSYNGPNEIILDPSYDFINQVAFNQAQEQAQEEDKLKPRSQRTQKTAEPPVARQAPRQEAVAQPRATPQARDAGGRLKQLDQLRAQKLITEAEYQKLRQKILSEL